MGNGSAKQLTVDNRSSETIYVCYGNKSPVSPRSAIKLPLKDSCIALTDMKGNVAEFTTDLPPIYVFTDKLIFCKKDGREEFYVFDSNDEDKGHVISIIEFCSS
jgi:hypothetical protein